LKKLLLQLLKFILPLGLGIFLIYYIYSDLSEEDKANIFLSLKNANYGWVLVSIALSMISHVSRAYRWKILLKPMGFNPKLYNSFFAVMIGYLANMAFPRLGEISRAAVLTKYEKIPFEKGFGTIMAERVIDMLILFILTLISIVTQFDLLGNFLNETIIKPLQEKLASGTVSKLIFLSGAAALGLIIYFIIKKVSQKFGKRIKNMLNGFAEGFKTILKIERKAAFLFHTLLIWVLYFLLLWVCFFSIPETSQVSVGGVLAAFVFGSFGLIAVQGGIGAYPAIVTKTLILYNVAAPFGFALGWIAWTGQAFMILMAGVSSIVLLPLLNKKPIENEQSSDYPVQDISA
jgi:glycosyltransferase 2 family protein